MVDNSSTHEEPGLVEFSASSWTLLFEDWAEDRGVRVHCFLDDGSVIAGDVGSFNDDANDGPDRDLILVEPLEYKYPQGSALQPYRNVSVACISAARIVSFFVTYYVKPAKDADAPE